MNERLRELAMLANIEFTYDPTENPPKAFAECWEDELEKFAELIVRECIGVVDKDDGATHVRELLEEHFGVES